jgi:hypothetical protein
MCAACVQVLSAEVASYLGLELGKIKIKRFADGEIYVQVQVRLAAALAHARSAAALCMAVTSTCMFPNSNRPGLKCSASVTHHLQRLMCLQASWLTAVWLCRAVLCCAGPAGVYPWL